MDEMNMDTQNKFSFENMENLSEQLNRHSRRYSTPFYEEEEAMLK